MKIYYIAVSLCFLLFLGCNSADKQRIKDLSDQDSTLMLKTKGQDSTIMAYVRSFNDIQDNLDSIKAKAKILSVNAGGENADKKDQIIADMKYISELMMKNKREIAALQHKLKKANGNNAELQKMIAHLTQEITEKDAEIASLQSQLAETNASLKDVIQKFNDSMNVINQQKQQINEVTTELHTVYYAVGTAKELKKKNVITKEGGVIGIGSTTELKQNFNTSYFTKSDETALSVLPLYSRFEKVVTNHPTTSYRVTNNQKSDSLIITDAKAFWSQSKYLVVIVK
jgi:hypothetical protein